MVRGRPGLLWAGLQPLRGLLSIQPWVGAFLIWWAGLSLETRMSFLGAVQATELGADTPQHQEASSVASGAVCLPRASPHGRPDMSA